MTRLNSSKKYDPKKYFSFNSSIEPLKKLTMQVAWSPVYNDGTENIDYKKAKDFCDNVSKISNGELLIEIVPFVSAADSANIGSNVSNKIVDMGWWDTTYWYDLDNTSSLFGQSPSFGLDKDDLLAWINEGEGRQLYNQLLNTIGFNYYGFFSNPGNGLLFGIFDEINTTINNLIANTTFTANGLWKDILTNRGITVDDIVNKDRNGNLIQQKADNAISNNDNIYLSGDILNYLIEVPINLDVWNSLSPKHKDIISNAIYVSSQNSSVNNQISEANVLQICENTLNCDVKIVSNEIVNGLLESMNTVLNEKANTNAFFNTVLESLKKFAKKNARYKIMNQPNYLLAYNSEFIEGGENIETIQIN